MAVGFVKLDTTTFLRTATVMRNWCDISNHVDANAQRSQSTDGRLATWSWSFDFDIKVFDTLFNRSPASNFRSYLSSKWCRFTRTLETLTTRRCPRQGITLPIGDGNDGVVEGCVYVRNPVSHVLADFFTNTLGGVVSRCFCHIDLSEPIIS